MKYEFHAEYPFAIKDSITQAFAMQWLAGETERLPARWKTIKQIDDPVQRLAILAQAMLTGYKNQARTGSRMKSGGYKFWLEKYATEFIATQKKMMKKLGILNPVPDIADLPPNSFLIHFTFTLRKPYISKDDTEFHILENPVKKEWVFKIPYVAPGQWKGALRAAMVQQLVVWWQELPQEKRKPEEFAKRRFRQTLLFGNEKGEEDGSIRGLAKYLNEIGGEEATEIYHKYIRKYFKIKEDKKLDYRGRLYFFSTFFDKIGLEVINPHDRETGAGSNSGPILIECAPVGAKGEFMLLYVSSDKADNESILPSEGAREAEIGEDMNMVAEGIRVMFTRYGFGAKTSSGYGVADINPTFLNFYPEGSRFQKFWTKGWEENSV